MVVEMGGRSILGALAKPDPFLGNGCLFPEECPIDPKQNCWGAKLIYQLECFECGAQYVGTTGHSIHKRSLEHEKATRRGDSNNGMAKHYTAAHPEIDLKAGTRLFTAKAVGRPNIQHNIIRYITEAATIEEKVSNLGPDMVLNSRGEWGRVQLRRLTVASQSGLNN